MPASPSPAAHPSDRPTGLPTDRRAFLAWLGSAWAAAAPAAGAAVPSPPRPMLAREAPAGLDPRGFLVSEKLDGVRALWDGRVLRFRSGAQVSAPRWLLAALPVDEALDGELWLGRGRFEALSGTVRSAVPDDGDWAGVRYLLFDAPAAPGPFAQRAAHLQALAARLASPFVAAVAQERIDTREALLERLRAVVGAGGEGLMLHRADAMHAPGRSEALLKLKPVHDAEAIVVAHEPGQGRHAGRLGALRVRTAEGVEFRIGTGLTDAQRESPPAIGRSVTYTHRGHTAGGVPRFASFLRVRDER